VDRERERKEKKKKRIMDILMNYSEKMYSRGNR
jgi:hypothetical protein